MKKLLLITLFAVLGTRTILAQGNKSVFLELGGNGLGISANFDSRFTKSEKGFGFRVGIGFIPGITGDQFFFPSTPPILCIPVAINHLAGKAPHYFESGVGVTYVHISGTVSSSFWGFNENVNGSGVGFVPSLGYRYAKTGKAFQFRVVISPIIGSGGTSFWGGVSFGYKF
jgi:hypothetical protein